MLVYFALYFHDVTSGFSYVYTFAPWTNLNLILNHNLIYSFTIFVCLFLIHMTANLLGVQVTGVFEPVLFESNQMLTLASVLWTYAEGLVIILNCYQC